MQKIRQINDKDCGFTALKNLLAMIKKDDGYLYLPCDETEFPYSLKKLCLIAKDYGVELEGFQSRVKEKINFCNFFPFIATIHPRKEVSHAVIVMSANRVFVKVYDPSKGTRILFKKQFCSIWDGVGLRVSKTTSSVQKIPPLKISLIKPLDTLFVIILQILSAACLILATFFMTNSFPFVFPIMSLAFSLIFDVVFRSYSFFILKKIDKKMYKDIPEKVQFSSYFSLVEKAKSSAIKTLTSLSFSLIIVIFLAVISILDSVFNIIPFIVCVIVSLLSRYVFGPFLNGYIEKIKMRESFINDSKEITKNQESVKTIHFLSYRYGYIRIALASFYTLLIILSTVFSMILGEFYSLQYIVFYCFVFLLIYRNINSIFDVNEEYHKTLCLKARIANCLYGKTNPTND